MVDFSHAKLLDRKWWMRLNWLLAEVETAQCLKLIELRFLQNASALDYTAGETFQHHWKQLSNLYDLWSSTALPWASVGKGRKTDEIINVYRRALNLINERSHE